MHLVINTLSTNSIAPPHYGQSPIGHFVIRTLLYGYCWYLCWQSFLAYWALLASPFLIRWCTAEGSGERAYTVAVSVVPTSYLPFVASSSLTINARGSQSCTACAVYAVPVYICKIVRLTTICSNLHGVKCASLVGRSMDPCTCVSTYMLWWSHSRATKI